MRKFEYSSRERLLIGAQMLQTPPVWNDNLPYDSPRIECVYFLRARNGFVKIGQTVDLKRRLESHKKKWHDDLEFRLIGFLETPNHYALEQRLHLEFGYGRRRKRKRGDWFALQPEDIHFIKSLGGAS